MPIQDQIAALPVDDFPEAFEHVSAKPAVTFPLYTKQWWIDHYGPGPFRSWYNGTNDRQTLEMHLALPRYLDEASIKPSDRCVRVVIEPGETLDLPKIWDRAIRLVRHGEVVGGMAPRLSPVNSAGAVLSEGLAHFDTGPFEAKP